MLQEIHNFTLQLIVRPRGQSSTSLSEDQKRTSLRNHDNRDSGICSSESTEDRLSTNSPTVHPCFTDSSLPRVSVCETGAIYTQVKRPSVAKSSLSPTSESKTDYNRSAGSLGESESNVFVDSDKVKTYRNSDDDSLFLDFEIETFGTSANKRGSSLVDEIMSELKIQQENNKPSYNIEENNVNELTQDKPNHHIMNRKLIEFNPIANELSPIKSEDKTVTERDFDFLCSSFIENDNENLTLDITNASSRNNEEQASNIVDKLSKACEVASASLKRHPSSVSAKIDIAESLAELRTRLVQLKKDRFVDRVLVDEILKI